MIVAHHTAGPPGLRPWLVLVEPDLDEARRVTPEQVAEALAWLTDGIATGRLLDAGAYVSPDGAPRTGGYMIALAPDRAALDEMLRGYPLRDTITADVRPVGPLRPGFSLLMSEVDRERRDRPVTT